MTTNPTGPRTPERKSTSDEPVAVKSLAELIEELARLAARRVSRERSS